MTVYADNAATTRLSDTALKAMMPYMQEVYGNPSSLHAVGQDLSVASDTEYPILLYSVNSGMSRGNQFLYGAEKRKMTDRGWILARLPGAVVV